MSDNKLVIESKHLKSKPKRVGTLGKEPVLAVETSGGLHVLAVQKSTGLEVIGDGPHRQVARIIAQRKNKDLKLFELSKSEEVDLRAVESMIPKYTALMDSLNAKLKK